MKAPQNTVELLFINRRCCDIDLDLILIRKIHGKNFVPNTG